MKGIAKELTICGKHIKLGDYVEVDYRSGGGIRGEIVELWDGKEDDSTFTQARVKNGWCFHDYDIITKHQEAQPSA